MATTAAFIKRDKLLFQSLDANASQQDFIVEFVLFLRRCDEETSLLDRQIFFKFILSLYLSQSLAGR